MKKFAFGLMLLISAAGSLSSCKDSSKIPAPDVTSVPLIFPQVSTDPAKSYLDFSRTRASENALVNLANPTRPVFEFTINLQDQRDVKIKAVEVYKSYRRYQSTVIGPRVLAGTYTSFPATVSFSSQDVLTGLQRIVLQAPSAGLVTSYLLPVRSTTASVNNNVVAGDNIIFTFEYVLEDDSRVILTPLTDVPLVAPNPPARVISGTQINPPYALYATILTR